jgi:hypothetical protein
MTTNEVTEQIEKSTEILNDLRDSGKISKRVMNEMIALLATTFNMAANWAGSDPEDPLRMEFTYRYMSSQDRT